jgi:hypothetical protein
MALAARVSNATVRFHGKRQVKMGPVELTLFALALGLTACGLAGSAMELISGRRLAFVEPYVACAYIALAGCDRMRRPFMFVNAPGRLAGGSYLDSGADSCGCTAMSWSLGAGVVLTAIASWVSALLMSDSEIRMSWVSRRKTVRRQRCRSMRSTEKRLVSRTPTATGSRPTPR